MKIKVNGETIEIQSTLTISELLKYRDIESPETVSVELNEEIVHRQNYDSVFLHENDTLEFLYFMGGGDNE